jgi:FtsH-binding integral membrane protein
VLAAVALALALAPAAQAATTHGKTVTVIQTVPAPAPVERSRLESKQALKIFLAVPKVKDWLARYPKHPQTQASYKQGTWTIYVWSGKAGEIAQGQIDDASGNVLYAWTGPQVAWGMARGSPGAFGGKEINSYPVWLGLSAVFIIGLLDWRRLRSLRTLDVAALWSFSASLWFFNRGHIFAAMPIIYPGMFWLLFRCLWIGRTDRPSRGRAVWPVWVLAAAAVFVAGFRIGLDVRASNVIDVGYSGVIGADRIWHAQSPYGHFPVEDDRPACGPADSSGEIRDRVQTNGHCESANPEGDTYGPVAYEAYIPGYRILGWSHKWDKLPAVKFTTILFDLVCLIGLALVGRRFGGNRLAATLAFAWVAWPFSQYANSSNTNDVIMPALLVWGFVFITSNPARGAFAALAGWTKFAGLIVAPLWLGYPEARRPRPMLLAAAGFVVATAAAFSVLFFEPSPIHAAHVFFDRTVKFQLGRASPFSLWDWRQYHAKGIPNLHVVQYVLQALLVIGAVALFWWPRRRSPLRLAAFTAVLLIGFEIVLTHWSYLYMPWFYPFVTLTLLAPLPADEPADEPPAEPIPA